VGTFESSRSYIGGTFFFYIFGTDVAFWARLATSRLQPTTLGPAAAARRRHGLEVEDKAHLKFYRGVL
jgi:hypothetical protein